MSLKRRSRSIEAFSMASMTDIIFLLLIFFMITSTLVVPNVIKVALPTSERQAAETTQTARITMTSDLRYYIAYGQATEREIVFEDISANLAAMADEYPDLYLAIYADESVPYSEVVRIISIASKLNIHLMLATEVASTESVPPIL